jgi:hypothetical protein
MSADPTGITDLEIGGRRYLARWVHLGTVEHLRVNVRVEPSSGASGRMHTETLDLYSPRSRRMFATRASRLLGTTSEAIDNELAELLVAVDRVQQATRAASEATAVNPEADEPLMSESDRRDAVALLEREDLIDQVARDIESLGYVGEETNKKLGYLISVSRKLPQPLSAIIVSQSGAGKSGLASALERLAPPEEVVFWSRLTPQALYYVDRDFLKRKLVVIEEREGSDAADYSIRTLQSKQKLVQAVPVKDPATGTIRTRTMEVEGPAAFLETTTRYQINPENASRCFELFLDESPLQTARIHKAQRAMKTPAGLDRRARNEAMAQLHHNAQRLLEPVAVVIPYADLLTFPASSLRTRRDHLRLLNLIEAVAFLYQRQRTRKQAEGGEDYIEATPADYAVAYELAAGVLGFGLDELHKPARDLLAVVEERVQELADSRNVRPTKLDFTQREVRTWSGLPNHQVKRTMAELVELEYLETCRAMRGSRSTYRLLDQQAGGRQAMAGLLTPLELTRKLNEVPAREAAARHGNVKVGQSGKRRRSTTFAKKN